MEAQRQRDELRNAVREINTIKSEMHEMKSMMKQILEKSNGDRSVLSNSFETFRTTFNSTANDVGDIADLLNWYYCIFNRYRRSDSSTKWCCI